MAGAPFTKEQQLARGERRYRRHVASAKQWQKIIEAKRGPCRICQSRTSFGGNVQYHHLIPRSLGGGDTAANIVPLCAVCHDDITCGRDRARLTLAASLTDAEYAHLIEKLGDGALERLFGIRFGEAS